MAVSQAKNKDISHHADDIDYIICVHPAGKSIQSLIA